METIEHFIKTHSLISCNSLEKLIGIPTGSIRLDGSRGIPEKYKQSIIDVLKCYGYDDEEQPIPIVEAPVVDNGLIELTYIQKSFRYRNDKSEPCFAYPKDNITMFVNPSDFTMTKPYKCAF